MMTQRADRLIFVGILLIFVTLFLVDIHPGRTQAASERVVTGTLAAVNDNVRLDVHPYQAVAFTLTGTFTATIAAQISNDGGTTWTAVDLYNFGTELVVINTTTTGQFSVADLAGARSVRIIATAFTSGTVAVTAVATNSARMMNSKFDGVPASATPNHAALVGGSDGTNLRSLSVSTGGVLNIFPQAVATGGAATFATNALTATIVTYKASGGTIYGLDFSNAAAGNVLCYVQLFNNAAPTLGTTAPTLSFEVPAGASRSPNVGAAGATFGTAITAAAATTATGSAPCAATVRVNAILQ